MDAPQYQDIAANTIPTIETGQARVKVISGTFERKHGPATHVSGAPIYLDVKVHQMYGVFEYPVRQGDTVLLYVIAGALEIGTSEDVVPAGNMILTTLGDTVRVKAAGVARGKSTNVAGLHESNNTRASGDAHFLLMAGTPLGEPVAWHGPIVMNSEQEIQEAYAELRSDTFIK
jgi:redox-sensitive bicupin YhaK (pirin superfamily)